jgi:hypothetical protein
MSPKVLVKRKIDGILLDFKVNTGHYHSPGIKPYINQYNLDFHRIKRPVYDIIY